METKDIIIIVLGVFTAILTFLSYHIYRKLHKLEKEKFQYQKEMDEKKEQDEEIREIQQEIGAWPDKKLRELHSKSDKKLLNDFPNTTPDELARFRAGDYSS